MGTKIVFDTKEDNRARNDTRKASILTHELRRSEITSKPTLFGLPTNVVFKGQFDLSEDQINLVVLEFPCKEEDLDIEGITELLAVNGAKLIDKKEHKVNEETRVTRILVNTKEMI